MEIKKIIDKVALIYIKDNKFLHARSKGRDKFYIPGGKREKNETDVQTLIREIKEELGTDLKEENLKFLEVYEAPADRQPEGTIVRATCYIGEFIGEEKASSEIEELAYLGINDRDKLSLMGLKILDSLVEKGLIK